jgi:uncharacterized protein HemX
MHAHQVWATAQTSFGASQPGKADKKKRGSKTLLIYADAVAAAAGFAASLASFFQQKRGRRKQKM